MMLQFVDTVIVPDTENCRKKTGDAERATNYIFDVFAMHRTKSLLQKLAMCNMCLSRQAAQGPPTKWLAVHQRIQKREGHFHLVVCQVCAAHSGAAGV